MKIVYKWGMRILTVMLCVLLACPSVYVFAGEPALTAENLFAQMEADGVYQQYADLMETSVRYQDEKEQVWEAIHTAVELQHQALKDGTETLMPEEMAQYMSANDLDYDMTGGDLYQSAEQWDEILNLLYSRLQILQNELNMVLNEANGIASMYTAGSPASGLPQVKSGGLLGGNGKLILGVLIGAILGATGATAATRRKKHV